MRKPKIRGHPERRRGNRSVEGMKVNLALFTIMATDRINGVSFFDHLVWTSSGDG